MKYPETFQEPSVVRAGVTSSVAWGLFSNSVSNCMTTYSPSGAPGSVVAKRADLLRFSSEPPITLGADGQIPDESYLSPGKSAQQGQTGPLPAFPARKRLPVTRSFAVCGKLECLAAKADCRVICRMQSEPPASGWRRSVTQHVSNPRTYWWMSLGLFAISLLCDGFYVDGPSPRAWSLGFGELIAGWYAALEGVYAWWANPLLLAAWMTFRSRSTIPSTLCSIVALGAMGSFLRIHRIEVSEAGNSARITGYGAGYWIWISSGLVLLAGNIIRRVRQIR